MDIEKTVAAMKAIIAEERRQGCPMAHEDLIAPAMRRWRTYDRRLKRCKDKSVTHRAQDLKKGLIEWNIENHGYGYDPSCLQHLAESFAEFLSSSMVSEECESEEGNS